MVTHTAESIKKIFRASGGAARFPRKRKAICHGLCYDKNMEKGSSAAGWWKPKFQGTEDLRIWEMDRFRRAWDDWPGTDNPYQGRDRAAPREIIGIVPVSFPVHSLCFKVYFYRI
ncbi:MAG TPA: hypothetical protein IAB71_03930 [Candidatus Scatomonas pullistercoris]|uniref:Uncharacterized protein n=1 Tax=Candidatus Scatomonas pullistercoris TaxID=2840920 RepID=A0A9D1TAR1_9FIRM|nr:hypothetical protein [Candidatus Scatomonas pullistercoris]